MLGEYMAKNMQVVGSTLRDVETNDALDECIAIRATANSAFSPGNSP